MSKFDERSPEMRNKLQLHAATECQKFGRQRWNEMERNINK